MTAIGSDAESIWGIRAIVICTVVRIGRLAGASNWLIGQDTPASGPSVPADRNPDAWV